MGGRGPKGEQAARKSRGKSGGGGRVRGRECYARGSGDNAIRPTESNGHRLPPSSLHAAFHSSSSFSSYTILDMNTGSVLYEPSLSPAILSRPSSAMHDDHSMGRLHSQYNNYSTPPPHNPSRPPANGRHSYSHQPFPLNPSPRHFLYPPYAQSPPPPISLRSTARHPPPPMLDDPAFSSDPRANPHFAMTIGEQIIPLNSPAANLVSRPRFYLYQTSARFLSLFHYLP